MRKLKKLSALIVMIVAISLLFGCKENAEASTDYTSSEVPSNSEQNTTEPTTPTEPNVEVEDPTTESNKSEVTTPTETTSTIDSTEDFVEPTAPVETPTEGNDEPTKPVEPTTETTVSTEKPTEKETESPTDVTEPEETSPADPVKPTDEVVHKHDYKTTVVAPSCTDKGYTIFTCDCGDGYIGDETAAKGHQYDDFKTVRVATCTSDGVKTRTCTLCKHKDTETISAYGHNYKSTTIAATCTEKGCTKYSCKNCDSTYTENEMAALGHKFGSYATTKNATCTVDGVKTKTCKTCGKKETAAIPAIGHDFSTSYTVDKSATCTASGSKSQHCSRCSATQNKVTIPATGHSYGSYVYNNDATEKADGTETRTCSGCGNKDTRTASGTKLAHTHSYSGKVTKAATCTANGVKTYSCSCGNGYTEPIAKLGHNYKTSTVAATCTSKGYTKHTCTNCGDSYTSNEVATTGHSYGSYVYNNDATTEADGTETRTCSGCGKTETRTASGTKLTPVHTHSYKKENNIYPPCASETYEVYNCECGDWYDVLVNVTPTADHTWSHYEYNCDATETEDGTETRYCELCGLEDTRTAEGTKIENNNGPYIELVYVDENTAYLYFEEGYSDDAYELLYQYLNELHSQGYSSNGGFGQGTIQCDIFTKR